MWRSLLQPEAAVAYDEQFLFGVVREGWLSDSGTGERTRRFAAHAPLPQIEGRMNVDIYRNHLSAIGYSLEERRRVTC